MLSPELRGKPFTQPPDNSCMLQMQKHCPKPTLQRDLADLASRATKQWGFHPAWPMGHPLHAPFTAGYELLHCSPQQTSHVVRSHSQEDEAPFIFPANIPTEGSIPRRITSGISKRVTQRTRHTEMRQPFREMPPPPDH